MILPPFEMALRAGARSVMNSYTDLYGVPVAADPRLLSDCCATQLGFSGTVTADYFSIAFLQSLHGVAASPGEAAALALEAGIDVELPSLDTYGDRCSPPSPTGSVDEKVIDRALSRVLQQTRELGLLDPGWAPLEPARRRPRRPRVVGGRPRARAAGPSCSSPTTAACRSPPVRPSRSSDRGRTPRR